MATKLSGKLNLSKIPKELIKTNDKTGEKYIWIDVVERMKPSQYGDTHTLKVWGKDCGTVYLADLRPQEFGSSAPAQAAAPASAPVQQFTPVQSQEDLPF